MSQENLPNEVQNSPGRVLYKPEISDFVPKLSIFKVSLLLQLPIFLGTRLVSRY